MFIMLTNVRQRKSLNPDRIQAHDLPNTGWVLYPPSYREPYSVLGHLLVSYCDTNHTIIHTARISDVKSV